MSEQGSPAVDIPLGVEVLSCAYGLFAVLTVTFPEDRSSFKAETNVRAPTTLSPADAESS